MTNQATFDFHRSAHASVATPRIICPLHTRCVDCNGEGVLPSGRDYHNCEGSLRWIDCSLCRPTSVWKNGDLLQEHIVRTEFIPLLRGHTLARLTAESQRTVLAAHNSGCLHHHPIMTEDYDVICCMTLTSITLPLGVAAYLGPLSVELKALPGRWFVLDLYSFDVDEVLHLVKQQNAGLKP